MTDPQQLRAIVAAWWEDTFVDTDYVIDRGGNYRNAKDCIEDIVVRARAALAKADEPAVPEGREPAAVAGQPSDAELVGKLVEAANGAAAMGWDQHAQRILRAAELLQRQALVPVVVGKRPWEREEWCDTNGLCWLGSDALDGCTPTWLYGPPAWAERFPTVHRVVLPAHALPLPEVGE